MGDETMRIFKIRYNSNNQARNGSWALRRLPNIRLGCCVIVALMTAPTAKSEMDYMINKGLVNFSGLMEPNECITTYDLDRLFAVHQPR
jgi:hypothetical protein